MNAQRVPLQVGERQVVISKPQKQLWVEPAFTKTDLIEYYLAVAPVLIPHVARRPMTLVRFPDGIDGPGWYQINTRGNPDWVELANVTSTSGEALRYCLIDEPAALAWAANQGTIEFHPFLNRAESPVHPDVLVFDLDPGRPAGLSECARVALRLRRALSAQGLRAYPKTSGRRGLHLYVPLNGSNTYVETEAFAVSMARALAAEMPELVVHTMGAEERIGKVLIDWRQNQALRSMIAPYSLRAMRSIGASAPVTWDEVMACAEGAELRFGPRELLARIEKYGDLFADVLTLRQALPIAG